jgi:hypothetical protein
MPESQASLFNQLNAATFTEDAQNALPIAMYEELNLRVDGTVPVDVSLDGWTGLATSPLVTISDLDILMRFASNTVTFSTFMQSTALTNGITLSITLRGTVVVHKVFKTLEDFIAYFDEFSITADDTGTTVHQLVKLRKSFAKNRGVFLQLLPGNNDEIVFNVADDLSAVGITLKAIVHGFGYALKA